MNSRITTPSLSYINSIAESITVYAPNSGSISPPTRDDYLNSESYDSILICNDIDIVKEIDKVKGEEDDDLFKLLSMNFYTNKEPLQAPYDRLAPKADKEYGAFSKKSNAQATGSKAKNKLRDTLQENFFDLEKLKKEPSSKQSSMLSDNTKQKPKGPNVPNIKGFAGSLGVYFKSPERSPIRKAGPLPKFYSSFLMNKEHSNRDLSNGSKLTNSDVRYISLNKSKETSTTLKGKNKGQNLNTSQNRPLTHENKSRSPITTINSDPNRFKSSLREQIISTFSNPLDSSRKNPYLGSARKNEASPSPSTGASSLVGWRNSFYSNLDSKRMTIEQVNSAVLSVRGSAKKKEDEAKKSKGSSQRTESSSKGSVSNKRDPLNNISEEFSKQKVTDDRCASPYLFFEMANQSQNPSLHVMEERKDKAKGTKRMKHSVEDKKGRVTPRAKLYFNNNKDKSGSKNIKDRKGRENNTHSSYRDSYLSVRV